MTGECPGRLALKQQGSFMILLPFFIFGFGVGLLSFSSKQCFAFFQGFPFFRMIASSTFVQMSTKHFPRSTVKNPGGSVLVVSCSLLSDSCRHVQKDLSSLKCFLKVFCCCPLTSFWIVHCVVRDLMGRSPV